MMMIETIKDKDCTRKGVTYPGRVLEGIRAEIKPGKSIRLFGKRYETEVEKTFEIGAVAEYDSYNLHYLGKIVSITAKTVTIEHTMYGRAKQRRLSIYEFAMRNYDFDLKRISERNAETMQCI